MAISCLERRIYAIGISTSVSEVIAGTVNTGRQIILPFNSRENMGSGGVRL